MSPVRLVVFVTALGTLMFLHTWASSMSLASAAILPISTFKPPEDGPYRFPDSVDTFESYKYRETCKISSLDLHTPFGPLCHDRGSMLVAMSSGGRIGQDAPYMPRSCDMRWFTSDEVCKILGRFDKVLIVGDSMMRHVMGSINILIRKNMGYGAVTDWNFSEEERTDCFCNEQFDVKACSVQGIYKTADVLAHNPESMSCGNPINVIMEQIVRVPVPQEEIYRLKLSVDEIRGRKAFIFGHGLWSDLDLNKSMDWLDTVMHIISSTTGKHWEGLFVTPNASGKEKPDEWLVSQGNKALMLYEEAMGIEVAKRGIDHLGTWNMSIQSTKYDGVHLDMKGNLVKTMMIINWLNML